MAALEAGGKRPPAGNRPSSKVAGTGSSSKSKEELVLAGRRKLEEFRKKKAAEKAAATRKKQSAVAPAPAPAATSLAAPGPPAAASPAQELDLPGGRSRLDARSAGAQSNGGSSSGEAGPPCAVQEVTRGGETGGGGSEAGGTGDKSEEGIVDRAVDAPKTGWKAGEDGEGPPGDHGQDEAQANSETKQEIVYINAAHSTAPGVTPDGPLSAALPSSLAPFPAPGSGALPLPPWGPQATATAPVPLSSVGDQAEVSEGEGSGASGGTWLPVTETAESSTASNSTAGPFDQAEIFSSMRNSALGSRESPEVDSFFTDYWTNGAGGQTEVQEAEAVEGGPFSDSSSKKAEARDAAVASASSEQLISEAQRPSLVPEAAAASTADSGLGFAAPPAATSGQEQLPDESAPVAPASVSDEQSESSDTAACRKLAFSPLSSPPPPSPSLPTPSASDNLQGSRSQALVPLNTREADLALGGGPGGEGSLSKSGDSLSGRASEGTLGSAGVAAGGAGEAAGGLPRERPSVAREGAGKGTAGSDGSRGGSPGEAEVEAQEAQRGEEVEGGGAAGRGQAPAPAPAVQATAAPPPPRTSWWSRVTSNAGGAPPGKAAVEPDHPLVPAQPSPGLSDVAPVPAVPGVTPAQTESASLTGAEDGAAGTGEGDPGKPVGVWSGKPLRQSLDPEPSQSSALPAISVNKALRVTQALGSEVLQPMGANRSTAEGEGGSLGVPPKRPEVPDWLTGRPTLEATSTNGPKAAINGSLPGVSSSKHGEPPRMVGRDQMGEVWQGLGSDEDLGANSTGMGEDGKADGDWPTGALMGGVRNLGKDENSTKGPLWLPGPMPAQKAPTPNTSNLSAAQTLTMPTVSGSVGGMEAASENRGQSGGTKAPSRLSWLLGSSLPAGTAYSNGRTETVREPFAESLSASGPRIPPPPVDTYMQPLSQPHVPASSLAIDAKPYPSEPAQNLQPGFLSTSESLPLTSTQGSGLTAKPPPIPSFKPLPPAFTSKSSPVPPVKPTSAPSFLPPFLPSSGLSQSTFPEASSTRPSSLPPPLPPVPNGDLSFLGSGGSRGGSRGGGGGSAEGKVRGTTAVAENGRVAASALFPSQGANSLRGSPSAKDLFPLKDPRAGSGAAVAKSASYSSFENDAIRRDNPEESAERAGSDHRRLNKSEAPSSDFASLEQHIEDLTQEKYSLQRGLDSARSLSESLAQENSALMDDFNKQGEMVTVLKQELDRQQSEIRAQQLVVASSRLERDRALDEKSSAVERSQALAAEVIGLEEKMLRLRSQELRLQHAVDRLTGESESQRQKIVSLEKEKAQLRSQLATLQEERRTLIFRLRRAMVGGALHDVRGARAGVVTPGDAGLAHAATSTEDLEAESGPGREESSASALEETSQEASGSLAQALPTGARGEEGSRDREREPEGGAQTNGEPGRTDGEGVSGETEAVPETSAAVVRDGSGGPGEARGAVEREGPSSSTEGRSPGHEMEAGATGPEGDGEARKGPQPGLEAGQEQEGATPGASSSMERVAAAMAAAMAAAASAAGSAGPLGQLAAAGALQEAITALPEEEQGTVASIEGLLEEIAEERRAMAKALEAEAAAAAELRASNADLSRKLAMQTQRLELAVAQKMAAAQASTGEGEAGPVMSLASMSNNDTMALVEYVDESDEVAERVLTWILRLFPGTRRSNSLNR